MPIQEKSPYLLFQYNIIINRDHDQLHSFASYILCADNNISIV